MLLPVILFCSIAGAFAQSSSSSSSSSSSWASSGQLQPGSCPNLVADPIDYNRYSGQWYEVYRSANHPGEESDRCHITIWDKPINNMSRVTHRTYSHAFPNGASYYANAVQNDRGTFFTHLGPIVGKVPSDFYTLATDYSNYSIVWACDNNGDKHLETIWVFSRTPTVHSNLNNWIRNAFARYNLTVPENMISPNFVQCGEFRG